MAAMQMPTSRSATSEISRFCHTVSRIVPLPKRSAISARPRICSRRQPADRQHDADDSCRPACFCAMDADVAVLVGHRPRRDHRSGGAAQGLAVFLLDLGHEGVAAHAVEHVLQPRLLAVGAIAVVDEGAHDGGRDRHALVGLQQDAGLEGEIVMAGDAAELQMEVDAGLDATR